MAQETPSVFAHDGCRDHQACASPTSPHPGVLECPSNNMRAASREPRRAPLKSPALVMPPDRPLKCPLEVLGCGGGPGPPDAAPAARANEVPTSVTHS